MPRATHANQQVRLTGSLRLIRLSRIMFIMVAVVGFSADSWANFLPPPDSPYSKPFFSQYDSPAKNLSRIILPFLITFIIEAPVVVIMLRKRFTILAAALVSVAVNALTYPVAFYLYWYCGWALIPVEIGVIGLEFLLLMPATALCARLESLVDNPSVSRLLLTAVTANIASYAFGWLFIR